MKQITDIFPRDRAALAPLAGITGSIFRRICRRLGAAVVVTEMVSSDGLIYGGIKNKTIQLLNYREEERPIGFQLFGAEENAMAMATKKVLELRPDFIDINAGCPVKKVVCRGAGSALMQTSGILGRIVEKVAKVSDVPVTVKIRSGWDFESINAVEVAKICESAGASGITVHPRTRSQNFSGKADWDIIRQVKEAVSIPVIGSGDIVEPGDAQRMMDETGADSVMIGRKAMGNPWIFSQVNAMFAGEDIPPTPEIGERLDLALEQLYTMAEEFYDKFAIFNMRKFFGWYSKGAAEGSKFRQDVFKAETIGEVTRIVREFQERSILLATQEEVYKKMVGS